MSWGGVFCLFAGLLDVRSCHVKWCDVMQMGWDGMLCGCAMWLAVKTCGMMWCDVM